MIPAALAAALRSLDRRLDARRRAPVTVALSGGSDSLALLLIARAWTQAVGRPLCALTVDHGLHPDSAAWTRLAGRAAARLGSPWRALAWTGPKPATGLPAAARTARHALLAEATRDVGACVLLVGHTADDIAESDLIRTHTPAHGRLSEWSPSPAWPQGRGVFVLRPLLSLQRADLRAWLSAEGCTWLDDPSNGDLRFARTRARLVLQASPVRAAAAVPEEPAPPLAAAASSSATMVPDGHGTVELTASSLSAMAHPGEGLAKALACVSGRLRPPSSVKVSGLSEQLARGRALTATLGGARVRSEEACVRLTRELGRSPPTVAALKPGPAHVFDGRFELVASVAGWSVAPLAGRAASLARAEREALRSLPVDARPSLPVLLGPKGEVRLPQPFGAGPATALCLVGARLASALGSIDGEAALGQAPQPLQGRGAEPPLILS